MPQLAPVLLGEAGEGEDLGSGLVQERSRLREAALELGDDAGVLLVHRLAVWLGEDRAHHGGDEALRALGDAGQEVAGEVGATALPCGAGKRRRDRVDEAGVRVARDELDAGEAAGDETAQEGEPGRPVLAGDDVEAERLAEAVTSEDG